MAGVVKFGKKNVIDKIFCRHNPALLRCVSTTKNNKESSITSVNEKSPYQYSPDFSKPLKNKNWISYGFDDKDEKIDILRAHLCAFLMVGFFTLATLFCSYMPDYDSKNWARREAFIRLHEREILGLEPVDPNYVDPSKIVLPSDEELGDTEIII